MRRVLPFLLLPPLLVLGALAWIVFTEAGTRFALDQAQRRMDDLSLRVTGGTLWRGLDLADVAWSMPGVSVSADRLGLRWRLPCLAEARLCVDAVRSEALAVTVDPGAMPEAGREEPAEPAAGDLALPVAIELRGLALTDTRVTVAGGPAVALTRLTTTASLEGSDFRLGDTALEGLRVDLPAGDDADAGAPVDSPAEPDESGGELDLPVDVDVTALTLTDAQVNVAEGPEVSLARLATGLSLRGAALQVSPTEVSGLDVRVPAASGDRAQEPAAPAAPPDGNGGGPLALPLSVDLAALSLRDLSVAVAQGPEVSLARLDTALRLDDGGLRVAPTEASGLDVRLPAGKAAATDADDGPAPDDRGGGGTAAGMELPLAVQLARFTLTDTRVAIAGGPSVELDRFATGLSAEGSRVRIAATELDALRVRLPAAPGGDDAAPAAPPADAAGGEDQPLQIALPEVSLPLDVALERLTVTDALLDQGETRRRLDRLEAAASLAGSTLRLERLRGQGPPGRAALSGRVTMAGDWPLALSLDVTAADLLGAGAQRLSGRVTGSMADLAVELEAEGAVPASLQASAKVLTPDIPWTLSLTSPRLRWPLTGEPVVAASDVRLSGEGDVGSYRVDLQTGLGGPGIPSGQWRLVAAGDTAGARVESLEGELLGGRLAATGRVGWTPRVTWDVTVNADNLQPGRWREDLAGTVGGEVAVRGGLEAGGWTLDADIRGIDGRWRDRPLAVAGGVTHSAAGAWTLDDLRASSGDNRVRLDGRVDDGWDLSAELSLPRLAALWPGLAGRLSGELAVSGPLARPSVEGALDGSGVGWQDLSVQAVSLSVDVAELLARDSRVRLTLDGLRQGDRALGDASLTLDGNRAAHRFTVAASGLPEGMAADLSLAGALDLEAGRWQGRIASGRLALPDGEWRLAAPAPLDLGFAPVTVRLGEHCWRRAPASLCLSRPATYGPDGGRLAAAVSGFPLADLEPFLPAGVGLDASVDAEVDADWQPGSPPTATARIATADGRVTLGEDDSERALDVAYRRIAVDLDLAPEQATVSLDLDTEAFGAGTATVRVDPFSEAQRMSGRLQLDGIRLAPLQPFVPALTELEGAIAVNGDIGGTLREPAFNGEVSLQGGRVAIRGASVPLEAIAVTATVDGAQARIDGSFQAGAGTARIAGSVDWRDGVNASVALVGEGLEFGYPPIVRSLTLSPALALSVTPDSISVNGRLTVPSGRFVLEDLPAGSVSVSEDAVIVNDPGESEAAAGPSLKTNIYLVLGDDVRFEGFGAEGRLAGSLNLRQIGAAGTEANGEIRLEDARYAAYGQRLEIRRGRFLFAGPVAEPRLDVEAVRRVDSVVAGIRVTGSADQPEVTLFSEPPMAQADVLTYIITGSPPGSATQSEQELVAQAALSLGLFGGEAVGGALAERLGVENFSLGARGRGEDTQVAVSGNIAPNLIVSYGVGVFRPENTLTLRYYLSQRLYLEAVSGLESALDVFYSFDF